MTAEWLEWYYLIYALPAAVAVLVLLMSGFGGHHGGHGHAGHGPLHVHAPVHSAHGSEAGHAAHPAGHAAAHPEHGAVGGHAARVAHAGSPGHGPDRPVPGIGQQLLGFFGVGRAPLTVVIGSLLIGWGLFGLAATDLLRHTLHWPALLTFAPSLAAAVAGALLSAKLFGEVAARLMPRDESCAIPREGLLGLAGKVVYPVSESSGRVHVFDSFRTLHVEPARVSPGQPAIEKGTEVIVASMDPDHGYLIVEPLGFSRSSVRQQPSTVSPDETLQSRNHGS
jgi:membrane protein implicated in regulation of membrane protease activity